MVLSLLVIMASLIFRTNQLKPLLLLSSSRNCFGMQRTFCKKVDNPSSVKHPSPPGASFSPNYIDKLLLVWMKKYPSVNAVPNLVMDSTMEKARSLARVKISIMMVVGSTLIFIYMAYLGKRDAKRGESIYKMNMDFHKSMQEKDQK